MAWTYADLKAADAALSGAPLDLSSAWSALSAQTVTLAAQDIQWSTIRDVLMNNWDWGTLVACTMSPGTGVVAPGGALITQAIKAAADAIRESCIYGGTLRSSDDAVWGKLAAAANLLTPATVRGLSGASITAVTAARTPTLSKWPGLTKGDIQTARAQP